MKEKSKRKKNLAMIGQMKLKVNLAAMYAAGSRLYH